MDNKEEKWYRYTPFYAFLILDHVQLLPIPKFLMFYMKFIYYIYNLNITYETYILVTQLLKNLPALQEGLVQFLGQEDP